MTTTDDRDFPAALSALARVEFDYADGDGVDYEPYDAFHSAERTTFWLRHWTGNHDLDGDDLRPFGQDGSGGYAAFWLARPDRPLADQPVVFFGSEGSLGVVAPDLDGFLWLLADGFGPMEAVENPEWEGAGPNAEVARIAERHARGPRQPAAAVLRRAREEFPGFVRTIESLCR
ncbi:SMI1/KNR4 family protein [Streptomyces sp. LX-29]|uniref:SMI1/KNR4 family protein n=1 Tax=Streptomyces sp. LX-29 TaxID=2900152 RepID=UPI00240E972A|nr:SMI1/KNR4 family protein [Streptomyces sp. LX-29]WFB08413.1 SMI1/KNR4 family protein [Streptomyces sp. LX-29]